VNVAVSMLFAGISGSSTADAAGCGKILIPAMIKKGYDPRFAVAITACSSVMGVIIPPSILMVVWGGIMSTSVGALFLAGAVPGLLIAIALMVTVYGYAKIYNYPTAGKPSLAEFISGVYRTIKARDVVGILYETGRFSSISLFAIGTASAFGWMLSFYNVPRLIVGALTALEFGTFGTSLVIAALFLLFGLFIDAIPAIIILGTVLLPVALAADIHPVAFAIIGIISLAFGLVTPPYGLCLLISSSIAGLKMLLLFLFQCF